MQNNIVGNGGAVFDSISRQQIEELQIPLPPLEVQEQIVAELDGYTAIISGAKQIVENWKPTLGDLDKYELAELSKFCKIQNGYAFSSTDMGEYQENYLPVVKIGNVGANGDIQPEFKFHLYSKKLENFLLEEGDIVIAMTGATVGKGATIPKGKFLLNQRVGKVEFIDSRITAEYVRLTLQNPRFYAYCQTTATGGAQGNISAEEILNFLIPLPPIEIQNEVVSVIQVEREQIISLRKLTSAYEARTHPLLAKLWDS